MTEVQKEEVFSDVGELDTVTEQIKVQESADKAADVAADDSIPTRHRGKTTKELVDELEAANKNMGRYTQELGEVRKLADELIKSTLHKPKEQEVSNEVDIFTDPQEAMRRAIEANPVVRNAANYAGEAKRAMAIQQLASAHPDFQKVAADKNMLDWKAQNPILGRAFDHANANYDAATAIELLNVYKATQAARKVQITETEKAVRDKAMSAASVDSGGSGEKGKKIFRRADLMKLMVSDRKKYDSMQSDIMLAYSEGRVR